MPRFSGGTSRLKPGVQLILVTLPKDLLRNPAMEQKRPVDTERSPRSLTRAKPERC